MSAWICPNKGCANRDSLRKGDKCPRCGTEAKAFGFFDTKLLFEEKSRCQENFKKPDEKIMALIPPSNNCFGESLQGLVRLSDPSTGEQTLQLLKEISEQNKVIIQQNELICSMLKEDRKTKDGS